MTQDAEGGDRMRLPREASLGGGFAKLVGTAADFRSRQHPASMTSQVCFNIAAQSALHRQPSGEGRTGQLMVAPRGQVR